MNKQNWTRRVLVVPAAALACILLSGCIKDKIVIKVNKDGTGKIVVTRIFSKETASMIRTQRQSMTMYRGGGEDEGEIVEMMTKDPFFNEKALKMQAGRFGPLVSLAKARKFESGGACGYVAVYAFKDVNDIFVDIERLSQDGMSGMYGDMYSGGMSSDEEGEGMEVPVGEKSADAFEFRLTPGPTAKLQIMVPAGPDAAGDSDEEDPPAEEESDETAPNGVMPDEMMMDPEAAMMYSSTPAMFMGAGNEDEAARRMMKGMTFDLAVEVEGTDVKSSASHVGPKKNHITLMAFDADKIMASPAGAKMMKRASRYEIRSPREFLAAAGRMTGAMIETNREVTVEFK